MKCPSCGGEFTPPAGKSISNCPFCGEPLVKPSVDKKCETLADALAFVSSSYGVDTLLNGQRLVAFLHDYLPKGKIERNLIRNAFTLDIPQKLADGSAKPPAEQIGVMARCVKMMVDDYGVAQLTAEDHLWTLAEALGWQGRPAPEPEPEPAPVPKPAAQPGQAPSPAEPAAASEVPDGYLLEQGYISPEFITDVADMDAFLEDAYLLITDQAISDFQDILPLLEQVVNQGKRFVIIAADVTGEALAALINNVRAGVVACAVVKAPGSGDDRREILRDVAVYTGATLVGSEGRIGLREANLSHLGRSQYVLVRSDMTYVANGFGNKDNVYQRIDLVRWELEDCDENDDERIQRLTFRLEYLCAALGIESDDLPPLPPRPAQQPEPGPAPPPPPAAATRLGDMSRKAAEEYVINTYWEENGAVLGEKVYLPGNIPAKKLNGAMTSFAQSISPEEFPLLFYDDSLFGTGKTGFLLTNRFLYCTRTMEKPVKIPLDDVVAVSHNFVPPDGKRDLIIQARRAEVITHLSGAYKYGTDLQVAMDTMVRLLSRLFGVA